MGNGRALSQREHQRRDKRIAPNPTVRDESQTPLGTHDIDYLDESPSSEEPRISQRARPLRRPAPGMESIRGKSLHSRGRCGREHAAIHPPISRPSSSKGAPHCIDWRNRGYLYQGCASDCVGTTGSQNFAAPFGRYPSFIQTAEIFGTDDAITLSQDHATQRSDHRRNDMACMAESLAGVIGPDDRSGALPVRRRNSFVLEDLRRFGECNIPFSSGSDGEQRADTLLRIAIPHRRELYRYGFRFVLAENVRSS